MFIQESLREKAEIYFNFSQKHMGHTLGIHFEHISDEKVYCHNACE